MDNELNICATAFFRNCGKDIVTAKDFTMTVSLDMRWMSVKEAGTVLAAMLENGIMIKGAGGFLRPSKDLADLEVPIAYRPSKEFLMSLSKKKTAGKTMQAADISQDMFPHLIKVAETEGIPRKKFASECNHIKKKLGIDVDVAALMVLRDGGVNVTGLANRVYTCLTNRD